MKKVVIESPYAGDVERNKKYARDLMLDCLRKGEAPFLSHLLYTQVLDDEIPADRTMGISAGFDWGECADYVVVGIDYGISPGMQAAIDFYGDRGLPIIMRKIR